MFNVFTQVLLRAFQHPNYFVMIETQLSTRVKRGYESAVHYCYDVLSLCSKLDPVLEDEYKIPHILRGFMPSIRQRVFLLFFFCYTRSMVQEFITRVQTECQSDIIVRASNWAIPANSTPYFAILPRWVQESVPTAVSMTQDNFRKEMKELKAEFQK